MYKKSIELEKTNFKQQKHLNFFCIHKNFIVHKHF